MGSVGTLSLKPFAPFIALVATLCLTGGACTRPTPGYCGGDGGARNCKNGKVCNQLTQLCESTDAAAETAPGSDARDAGDAGPGDASDANPDAPHPCTDMAACATSDAGHACFVEAGTCVECLVAGDCKTGTRPVCEAHACRGCAGNTECTTPDAGHVCSLDAGACVECVASGDCTAATRPVCAGNACRGCTGSTECTTPDAGHACFVDAGTCVACVADADCKTATLPICEGLACRACKTDSECPDPGICMEDGHCATSGEVVFVEYRATGCPGAGSSANPFCAPADAGANIAAHPVIVIRGPANNQMTLDTTTPVVVVGKKNSAGVAPSIPAGAATGIAVSAGNVLIRDLSVTAGSAPSAKGIVVAGTAVRLRLLRVGVSLGTGLGVEADAGELDMNRCTVTGNSGGGILVNGAAYDITNTVVAGNGPNSATAVTWGGVYLQKAPLGSKTRFLFNTVVNNLQVGVACGDSYPIGASILRGNVGGVEATANCALTPCCAGVDPLLTADYHLMSGSPCIAQVASSMSVTDDLDGQARPATMSDCGADQR